MRDCTGRTAVCVEVNLGEADFNWPEDSFESYLVDQGITRSNIDAICLNYRTRWEDGSSEPVYKPAARNRLYDSSAFSVFGFPWVHPGIRGNDIARETSFFLLARAQQMGITLEDVLWLPGLYGECFDSKHRDYWVRPVELGELLNRHSRFVSDAATSSRRNVTQSNSGLFCFDRSRMHDFRDFARSLQRERLLQFTWKGQTTSLPCRYSDDVWALVEYVGRQRIENL